MTQQKTSRHLGSLLECKPKGGSKNLFQLLAEGETEARTNGTGIPRFNICNAKRNYS